MPCYDPDTHERPIRLENKVHKLTSFLCYLCQHAPPHLIAANPNLHQWWDNHQSHDRRVAAAKAKRGSGQPLTPEENGLLWAEGDVSYDEPPTVIIHP